MRGEEGVRPALMVAAPRAAPPPVAFPQNAAQAHTDPTVKGVQVIGATVLGGCWGHVRCRTRRA